METAGLRSAADRVRDEHHNQPPHDNPLADGEDPDWTDGFHGDRIANTPTEPAPVAGAIGADNQFGTHIPLVADTDRHVAERQRTLDALDHEPATTPW